MKKTVLLILCMLLMSSLAMAWDVSAGDVITQTQLNSVDADSLTKDDLKCHKNGSIYKIYNDEGEAYALQEGHCLSLKPLDNETFLVYEDKFEGHFKVAEYKKCVDDNGKLACVTHYWGIIKEQARRFFRSIKKHIKGLQSDITDTDLGDDFDDLPLF